MTTPTFSTSSDVEARWRPLTPDEASLADTLCEDVSRRVRRRWKTIDARIAAGDLDVEDVRMVVASVVKRAMVNSQVEGVTSASDTAGSYSRSVTYANPLSNVFFTKDEVGILKVTNPRVRSIIVTTANY